MGVVSFFARRRFEKALNQALRLIEQGQGERARAALMRALDDADRAFGGAGPDVATVHYALAAADLEAGDLDASLARALASEQALAASHPAVTPATSEEAAVMTLRIRALVAAVMERKRAGRDEVEQALRAWAEAARAAKDDEAVGAAENQLGLHLAHAGKRDEAAEHFLIALDRRTKKFGASGLATLETLYNAATFRDASRSLDVVGADLERIVRALEEAADSQGKQRERALLESSLHNLAALREEQGDREAAEALYERSLSLREGRLGPRAAALRPTLVRLAQLQHREGKIVHAIGLYDRALTIAKDELAADHPVVVALEAWKAELTEGVGPAALRRN